MAPVQHGRETENALVQLTYAFFELDALGLLPKIVHIKSPSFLNETQIFIGSVLVRDWFGISS